MSLEELPISRCWRCDSECDTCADTPPTPEELRRRADECMERIHNEWTESDGARSFLSDPTGGRQGRSWLKRLTGRNRRAR